MSKKDKHPSMISYAGVTVAVDTIAGFYGFMSSEGRYTHWGIKFVLRSGAVLKPIGDDEILRNRVLGYLQRRLTTQWFAGDKCNACANYKATKTGGCQHEYGNETPRCKQYDRYPNFKMKPEGECTRILSESASSKPATT